MIDVTQNTMMNSMMHTNLIGMMSMKDNVSMYQILFGIIVMNLMSFLPMIKEFISNYISKYIRGKIDFNKKMLEDSIHNMVSKDNKKEILSSILLTKNNDKDVDVIFNSINYHISNSNSAKFLNYSKDFSVVNNEIFKINEVIYCKVKNGGIATNSESSDLNDNYSIEIFSYDIQLSDLKKFIDEVKQKYLYEQKNKLGYQKFYFDEKYVSLPRDTDGGIRFDMAPKSLSFTMTPFHTNKSLSNVFGKHLTDIKERVNMFLNNREWYNKKGVPYTLGIMLHGPPGTGKTSIIKAVAKDSKRHVFNIKIHSDTTQTQLRNLFFNEKIDVVQNGKTESFNIPIEERIYVIEDIDCLTDIFNERKENIYNPEKLENKRKPSEKKKPTVSPMFYDSNNINKSIINTNNDEGIMPYSGGDDLSFGASIGSSIGLSTNTISDTKNNKEIKPFKQDLNDLYSGEKINLSFILNLLDGILETPGRILIITSNHPEKLDKAFIRPGRIDVNLKVGYCNTTMIQEMFEFFYETDCSGLFSNFEYNKDLTPAEVNKVILNNFNNRMKAFSDLNSIAN